MSATPRDKVIAVFGSSATAPGSSEWVDAEKVGARCAGAGLGVVTGGYSGVMEAVSRGASLAGGRVIGVTAPDLFAARPGANPHVTEERPTITLAERIGTLIDLASGVIALPGSIGTAAELVVAWNLNTVHRRNHGSRLPTVAVGDEWRALWELLSDRMHADREDIHVVDSADEAVDWLLTQPEIR